jgi:hypothetical protein
VDNGVGAGVAAALVANRAARGRERPSSDQSADRTRGNGSTPGADC